VFPGTGIHIVLNLVRVLQHIVHNPVLNRPLEEIKLPNRGLNGRHPSRLKQDSLAPTERVKTSLTPGLQLALVVEENDEQLFPARLVAQNVVHVVLFGIVCNEPVNQAQTDPRTARKNGYKGLHLSRAIVKLLERTDNELLIALYTVAESFTGL